MNHFDNGSHAPGTSGRRTHQAVTEQQQRRPKALATARLKVLIDGSNSLNRGHRLHTNLSFDSLKVFMNQLKRFARTEGLPNFGEHIVSASGILV